MVVLGLLRELIALSTGQLTLAFGSDRVDDPEELHERVAEFVAKSREQQRRLNNARISRRAIASSRAPSTPPPPARLHGFSRNGDYEGSFDRLNAIPLAQTGEYSPPPPEIARHLDLDGLALDLHLSGTLWTLADEGKVHVFRCADPQSGGKSPQP